MQEQIQRRKAVYYDGFSIYPDGVFDRMCGIRQFFQKPVKLYPYIYVLQSGDVHTLGMLGIARPGNYGSCRRRGCDQHPVFYNFEEDSGNPHRKGQAGTDTEAKGGVS